MKTYELFASSSAVTNTMNPTAIYQRPRPVLGAPHLRDEAACHEREAERRHERRRRPRVVLVVAREDERRRARRGEERERPEPDGETRAHASSSRSAAPERSAFEMNPRALEAAINDP